MLRTKQTQGTAHSNAFFSRRYPTTAKAGLGWSLAQTGIKLNRTELK